MGKDLKVEKLVKLIDGSREFYVEVSEGVKVLVRGRSV